MMIKTKKMVRKEEEEERMMMVVSVRKEGRMMMMMKAMTMMTPMMMALGWLVMINLLILTQGMILTCRGVQLTHKNRLLPIKSTRLGQFLKVGGLS